MTLSDKAALLTRLARERILIKDGPYGTAIQEHRLSEADFTGNHRFNHDQKGNNDLLNLTRPEMIAAVCDAYLKAGADIISTNTFNANSISQADYGTQALTRDINLAAARLTRARADATATPERPRFVAGAIGPTNKTLSISPDVNNPGYREVSFDQVRQVYAEQIEALLDGGVDFILIETVFDTLNAKAALFAADEVGEARGITVPVMISMTLTDLSGRNLSGQTVEAFWHSVRHARPLTMGLNCSFGATELRPHVGVLNRIVDTLVCVYPNAGLPNDMGAYDEAPHTTARLVRQWAEQGWINMVGGCCGTTPAHIRAIAEALAGIAPRRVPSLAPALRLSGFEAASYAA